MNITTAVRIAARWLGVDLNDAHGRVEPAAGAAAVYVRAADGRAVLVDGIGRVLLAGSTVPFAAHVKDFRAGWRSDYVAKRVA